MSNKAIVLVLLSFAAFSSAAQADSSASAKSWFITLHSGILADKAGGGGSAVTATLVQGVRYRRLSIGIGAGYDVYAGWQTLPVFAGAGYDLLRRGNNAFFLQLNAGYSKAWANTNEVVQMRFKGEGGFFYHPAVGYRIREGRVSLYLSAGYKFQQLNYEQIPVWSTWGIGGVRTYVQRNMERVSIQMGIGL
jgi:hypothetical protein